MMKLCMTLVTERYLVLPCFEAEPAYAETLFAESLTAFCLNTAVMQIRTPLAMNLTAELRHYTMGFVK
jgi:hypothetical protein